jgi:hypothetical protein
LAKARTIKAAPNLLPTRSDAKASPLAMVLGAKVPKKTKIFAQKMVKICHQPRVRTNNFDFLGKTVENFANGTLRAGNNNGKSQAQSSQHSADGK